MRKGSVVLMLLSLSGMLATAPVAAPVEAEQAWLADLDKHRAEREERLRAAGGWLTLAGLFWLEPGENGFGSDPDNAVVLTADGITPVAGQLVLDGETVTARAAAGAGLELDGKPVTERIVRADTAEGGPDALTLGRLRFHVIRRADRFGVRVKDPQHPALEAFDGLDYFAADPAYRLDAAFVPYAEPRETTVMTAVGTTTTLLVPGEVEFKLGGQQLKLLPMVSEPGDKKLWFIFKDGTSGKETYGFRYLYGDLAGGRVKLDFNRAYNPPCAFTPYATCPLPPRENRLDVRVEAGERIYGKH